MTERALETWARGYAKDQGVLMYKFSSPAQRGVPDDILFYNGGVWLAEFKHPNGKGKLSPLQVIERRKLAKQLIDVYVIDSKEKFRELIELIKQ
jgi:hypothetical protein